MSERLFARLLGALRGMRNRLPSSAARSAPGEAVQALAAEFNSSAILVRDRQGRVVGVNRAWQTLFGYSREDVLGKAAGAVVPALAGVEATPRRELCWAPAGKPPCHLIASDAIVADPQGETTAIVTTFTDISDRKSFEAALVGSREQLDLVLRATHAGIWDFDFKSNASYFSPRFKEILLYPSDADLTAQFIFEESLHPVDQPRMREAQRKHLESGETFDQEFRLRRADGAYAWVHGRGVTVCDAQRRPTRSVGSIIDISERKRAERELHSRERHYRELVETSNNLIWAVDVKGRFTFVNRRGAMAVLGYEPSEMIGKHYLDFGAGRDPNQDELTFDQLLHSRGVWTAETRWRRKDGKRVFLSLTAAVTRDPQGRAQGTLGTATDVTGRVEREKSLQDANRRALSAAQAKAEFLATMSHEIRTPLNGVIATTSLLLDTNLSEEQQEYTEIIRTSGETLLALINDVLDFSKIEADRLELERGGFPIELPFDEALDMLGERARQKGLEMLYRIEPDVPGVVMGDVARVRQVLLNVFSNAVKFTERGAIVAEVSLLEMSADAALIQCAVRDTGIGIPGAKLDRLFEPFTQADSSMSRRYGGTGLGLAICRRLTRMMGGDIRVDSTEGAGSCFTFSMRLGLGTPASPGSTPATLRGKRALIIESNDAARGVLQSWCRDWGMHAIGAAGTAQAIGQLAASTVPEIIIVSVAEGSSSADLFIHELRALDRLTGVPAVLLSPRPRRHMGRSVEEFQHVLPKPVKPAAMREALGRLLVGRAGPAGRDAAPGAAGSSSQGSIRALIAEDHEVNQLLARHMLEKLGCQVSIVRNGREAVEAVQHRTYDIVFMDMQMPEVDGLEATRRIRLLPACAPHELPIIAMTANVMLEDRTACLQAGMNAFLTKPLDQASLRATLNEWAPRIPVEAPREAGIAPLASADGPAAASPAAAAVVPAHPRRPAKVASRHEAEAPPVISRPRMAELSALDPVHRAELIALFNHEARRLQAELEAAVVAGERSDARAAAHALKGMSLNLGANEVAALARRIETGALHGDLTGLLGVAREISERLNDAIAALNRAWAPADT